MTSATEIHKPMTGGAEVDDDAGEAGGGDDDGADELELEKEGSGGTVIGGDGSTASLVGPRGRLVPGHGTGLASSVDPNAASPDLTCLRDDALALVW